MKQLNESTQETKDIIENWRTQAREMTLDDLPKFINHLIHDYKHDYGTICHAMSVASVATMWAMNKEPQGGVTGFQAGAIMWENIQNWDISYKDKPLKLINYDKMLYPQYDYVFDKTISEDTWNYLQKKAKNNLEKEKQYAVPDIIKHWENIVNGIVPFGYKIEKD